MRALEAITGSAWAIRPEMLATMLSIVAREADANLEDVASRWEARLHALEATDGRPLDGTSSAQIRDGVATLRVIGPIARYAGLFSQISGMTSLESLRKDFETAMRSPQVRAILLAIDSPGGEAASIAEFAADLRAADAVKPVWAYIDDQGASAAYWLAASASRVVVASTAIVGSIGVVAAIPDPSKRSSGAIEIVSSQSPNKRPDPTTEGGRAQFQAVVDAVADVFVADVAGYRGVPIATVLADFGAGGVLIGAAAVTAGMADAVGTYEQTLSALAAHAADPGQMMSRQRRTQPMGMRDKFMSWLDGQDTIEASEQETPVTDATAPSQPIAAPTAESVALAAATAQAAELRAHLARVTAERLAERAEAFADQAITASRVLPSVRAQLVAVYQQVAVDDAAHGPVTRADGSSISRVDLLAQLVAATPAHGLTTERLVPTDARVLPNTVTTPTPGEGPIPEDRRTALLKASQLGQAVISASASSTNGKPHTN